MIVVLSVAAIVVAAGIGIVAVGVDLHRHVGPAHPRHGWGTFMAFVAGPVLIGTGIAIALAPLTA